MRAPRSSGSSAAGWLAVLFATAAISGCGSSGGDSLEATSLPEPATCTTTATDSTTAATDSTTPATTGTTTPAPDGESANTGTFTFDVVCQQFGDCHCDAALAEPLTATITFDATAMTLSNDEGTISYERQGDGTFRFVMDEDAAKVATIRLTPTGFVFEVTVNGAPCSTQTYTRR